MVLKLKVSGSYLKDRNSKEYEMDVYMPECDESYVKFNALRRAVPMALHKKGMPADYIRSCYIDEIENVEVGKNTPKEEKEAIEFVNSYIGKDIKEMTHEEIQNAAMALQLIGVPLYRQSDIHETRKKLYMLYSTEVKGEELAEDFDFAVAKPLKVEDKKKAKATKTKSNEEVLDEMENESKDEE